MASASGSGGPDLEGLRFFSEPSDCERMAFFVDRTAETAPPAGFGALREMFPPERRERPLCLPVGPLAAASP